MSATEIYPRIHFDGKVFADMGKMGDSVKVTIEGKIVSVREDEYGCCYGVEVYGVGQPGKDTKVVAPIVNAADAKLETLQGVNPI